MRKQSIKTQELHSKVRELNSLLGLPLNMQSNNTLMVSLGDGYGLQQVNPYRESGKRQIVNYNSKRELYNYLNELLNKI